MPPKSRGKTKGNVNPAFAHITKPSKTVPPIPFSRPPSTLDPFLSQLSKKHVYITSIDATPWKFKAQIFAVPVLMNIVILSLICWRITVIGPFYIQILSSLMGNPNETTMPRDLLTSRATLLAILSRFSVFLTDFLLYIVLWPWPRAFFGPSDDENPVAWRYFVRFRAHELTVRRSRRWDEALVGEDVVSVGGEASNAGQLFLAKVRAATAPAYMHDRTAYSMLSKDWDLDWRLMIHGTVLTDAGTLSLDDDFRTTVYIHSTQFGWLVFGMAGAGGGGADGVDEKKQEEGRRKILAFKDELTAMGKENLFFRWIELVQFDSSLPGGFGPDRQAATVRKAKDMFEAQGVDFDQFWAKIGGMEGMPGMDAE